MKKKLRIFLKFFVLSSVIFSIILPSFATSTSIDGSAFLTKAEFDAFETDIFSRLSAFEAGINSKIDSQVTTYLDRNGIWSGEEQTLIRQPATYWGNLDIGKYKWNMLDCFGDEGLYQTKADWDNHNSASSTITNGWNKYNVSTTFATLWSAIKGHSQVTNNGYDIFPVQIRWQDKPATDGYWAVLIDGTKDSKLETPSKGFFAPKRLIKANKSGLLMLNFSLRYFYGCFIAVVCPSKNTKSYKSDAGKTPRVDAKDLNVDHIRSYDLGVAFVRGDEVDSSENLVNGAIMYRKSFCSNNIVTADQYCINWMGNRCGSCSGNDANCYYQFPKMLSLDEVVTFFVEKGKNYYIAQSPVLNCEGLTVGALNSSYFYSSDKCPEVTVTNVVVY